MSRESDFNVSLRVPAKSDTETQQDIKKNVLDKLKLKLKKCYEKSCKSQNFKCENESRNLKKELQQQGLIKADFFDKTKKQAQNEKLLNSKQKLLNSKQLREAVYLKDCTIKIKSEKKRRLKRHSQLFDQQEKTQKQVQQNLPTQELKTKQSPYRFTLQKMGMLIKIFQLYKQTQSYKHLVKRNQHKQDKLLNCRRISMRKIALLTAVPKKQVLNLFKKYLRDPQGVIQMYHKAVQSRFQLQNDQIRELEAKAKQNYNLLDKQNRNKPTQNNAANDQKNKTDASQRQKSLRMLKSQLQNFQHLKISVNKRQLNPYQKPIRQFDKHQLFMRRKEAIAQLLQQNPLMPAFQMSKILSKRSQLLVPGMNHLPNNTVRRTIEIIKKEQKKTVFTQETPLNLQMNHPKRVNGTLCCFFNSPNIIEIRFQYAKLYTKLRSLNIPTYFIAQQKFVYYPPKDQKQIRLQGEVDVQNFQMLKQIIFKVKKDFQKLNPHEKKIFDNFLAIKKQPELSITKENSTAGKNRAEKNKASNILDLITQNKHEMAMYCMRENALDLQLQLFRQSTQRKHPLWQSIIQLTKPIEKQRKTVYVIAVISLEGGIQAWQMSTKPYNRQAHLNFYDKVLKLLSNKTPARNNLLVQSQSNRLSDDSNLPKKQNKVRFVPKKDQDQYDGYLFFYNKRMHDLTLQMLKKQHKGNIQLYCLPGKLSVFNPASLWMRDLMARVYRLWERQMLQVPEQPKNKNNKVNIDGKQMIDEGQQQKNKDSGNQTTQQRKNQEMLQNPKNIREFMLIIKKYIAQGRYDFQEYFDGIQPIIEKCLVKKELSMADIPINER